MPGGRRGCLQKSGLCTQAASLPFFFFFLLLLPGPQEIDTYIMQAKERSYETVLSFGKRGLNIAASAAVQAATKVPPPPARQHLLGQWKRGVVPAASLPSLLAGY